MEQKQINQFLPKHRRLLRIISYQSLEHSKYLDGITQSQKPKTNLFAPEREKKQQKDMNQSFVNRRFFC